MAELTLEIVEGPGAGQKLALDRPIVIGRAPDADLVLHDDRVSRHHVRVSPGEAGSAVVEDLASANGTFVNQNELHDSGRLDLGDELLVGVTLLELRSRVQVAERPSALRVVPPALAAAPRQPDYVRPEVVDSDDHAAPVPAGPGDLHRFLDVRVRRQAQLAPLALLMVIALALSIYFATR